jgi:hypothetical protein
MSQPAPWSPTEGTYAPTTPGSPTLSTLSSTVSWHGDPPAGVPEWDDDSDDDSDIDDSDMEMPELPPLAARLAALSPVPAIPGSPTPSTLSSTVSFHAVPDWNDDSDMEMPELPPLAACLAAPPPVPATPEVPVTVPAGLAQPEPESGLHPNDDDNGVQTLTEVYNGENIVQSDS